MRKENLSCRKKLGWWVSDNRFLSDSPIRRELSVKSPSPLRWLLGPRVECSLDTTRGTYRVLVFPDPYHVPAGRS